MIFGLVVSVGSTPTKRRTQFLGNTTSDPVIRNAGLGVITTEFISQLGTLSEPSVTLIFQDITSRAAMMMKQGHAHAVLSIEPELTQQDLAKYEHRQ